MRGLSFAGPASGTDVCQRVPELDRCPMPDQVGVGISDKKLEHLHTNI